MIFRPVLSVFFTERKYTFLSFDNGIRQKICSRMLYGIACGTRGWVYISSHGVGYDIPSLSARYCVAFGHSASTFSAELQDAMRWLTKSPSRAKGLR